MTHAELQVIRKAREALLNVPAVGEIYDQQHSDTQLAAILEIDRLLWVEEWKSPP